MSWHWLVLITSIQIIFLFTPFKDISGEFNIGKPLLPNIKEHARASNCIAILLSLPLFTFIAVLAAANAAFKPQGINPFWTCIYGIVAIAIWYLIFKLPASIFMGKKPYLYLSVVIIIEFLLKLFGIDLLSQGLAP